MAELNLATLARALERAGLDYMVIGGQAVLAYGEPRMTRDIDVTLAADPARLAEVLALVEQQGWRVMVADPKAFVARTWVLPCEEPEGLRLDFVFSSSPYERQAIGRARRVELPEGQVRIAAPEDLILHKLVAGRARDVEDVSGMLRRGVALDREYLCRWLGEFDQALGRDLSAQFRRLEAERAD